MTPIYYTAPYLPTEWIEAHGFDPQRLDVSMCESAGSGESARGVCPFARQMQHAIRSAWAKGGGVVLGTHCDQMRRMTELMAMREDGARSLFCFQMPATWKTEAASSHYRDELRRLSRFLVDVGGEAPDAMRLRAVMARSVSHSVSPSVSISRGACPRAFVSHVAAPHIGFFGEIPNTRGQAPPLTTLTTVRPRITLLAGDSIVTSPSLAERIHDAGGRVVLDATDRGERTRPATFEATLLEADPFEALARAYFDRIADTFRRPNSRLYDWLQRRMDEEKVQGLILHRNVWCDLWHAEVGRLKRWSRVPVLDLDDDGRWSSSLQTRLEAFLENIGDR